METIRVNPKNPLLKLLGDDVTSRIHLTVNDAGSRLLWLQESESSSSVHMVVPVPKAIHDTDGKISIDMISENLKSEPPDVADVLWTLLQHFYPTLSEKPSTPSANGLVAPDTPSTPYIQAIEAPPFRNLDTNKQQPTKGDRNSSVDTSSSRKDSLDSDEGSWKCTQCGTQNFGFKAMCEGCSSHAPAGWWKKGNKIGSLRSSPTSSSPSPPPQQQQGHEAKQPINISLPAIPSITSIPSAQLAYAANPQPLLVPQSVLPAPALFGNNRPKYFKYHINRKDTIGWTLHNDDLVLVEIAPGKPADKAGMKPGLQLIMVNNVPVRTIQDVKDVLASAGSSFEVVAASTSENPSSRVTLVKEKNEKMGTTFMNEKILTLISVDPNSVSAKQGLTQYIGWRLTHVNNVPVSTTEEVLRLSSGKTTLDLVWAPAPLPTAVNATPPAYLMYPGGLVPTALPTQVVRQQQPAVPIATLASTVAPPAITSTEGLKPAAPADTVDYPKHLWVQTPSAAQECGGLYELIPGQLLNCYPMWRHMAKRQWVYSSEGGEWCISLKTQTVDIRSTPHAGTAPHLASEWFNKDGTKNTSIRVTATIQMPRKLRVQGYGKVQHCSGEYVLMQSKSGDLDFEVVNGFPVWKLVEGKRWLYSTIRGCWGITDSTADFHRASTDSICSAQHGGCLPCAANLWKGVLRVEDAETQQPAVSIPTSPLVDGKHVLITSSIVTNNGTKIPEGALGVVSTGSTEKRQAEVLACGVTFEVLPGQAHVIERAFEYNDLVVPKEQRATWTCGRVHHVQGDTCRVKIPSGDVVEVSAADLRHEQYVVGERVKVKNIGEQWVLGEVTEVQASGQPVVTVHGKQGKSKAEVFEFVERTWGQSNNNLAKWSTAFESTATASDLLFPAAGESFFHKGNSPTLTTPTNPDEAVLVKGPTDKLGMLFSAEQSLVLESVDGAAAACNFERFVGRTLLQVNGINVHTCAQVKSICAGQTRLVLTFQ
eukprot:Sspe_Gene.55776::Locus_30673_Transcript_1_1_Confidence_1.000_Length_3232::g.55776::m.55776